MKHDVLEGDKDNKKGVSDNEVQKGDNLTKEWKVDSVVTTKELLGEEEELRKEPKVDNYVKEE